MSPENPLELSAAERAALGHAALEWCLRHFESMADGRVYPDVTIDALSQIIGKELPRKPQSPAVVMQQFAQIAAFGRNNGHPRMFGYVQSSGNFAAAVADFLASAINQNVTSWRSAPAATTLELQVIDWIKEITGFPSEAAGLLVSGGSMANFIALAVALRASTKVDITQQGVSRLPGLPRIYAPATVHFSVPKAAGLLGIGRQSVISIPVDRNLRMKVSALERALTDDTTGVWPVCVVANAGDVNSGAIDPLNEIADLCAANNVWLHVDASYGGFAMMAASGTRQLEGLNRANSISLDAHKWLFAPLDAGCVLVRDPAILRRAFGHGASYVDVIADQDMSAFAFWDYGPELSRRFRALKIWFALKCHGVDAIATTIERNILVAQHLAAAIDAAPDFERLAPSPLSIVCFRYLPPEFREKARGSTQRTEALNALNRDLMLNVQRDGDSYLSNAMIGEAFALRACIVNHRTTEADVERLLDTIRRVALSTQA